MSSNAIRIKDCKYTRSMNVTKGGFDPSNQMLELLVLLPKVLENLLVVLLKLSVLLLVLLVLLLNLLLKLLVRLLKLL